MDGRTGSFRFWAVTIMLVIVTACCCAGTVMSRTDFSAQELEHYDRERERQMVEDVREYLRQRGYGNSGVMLTRVMDADGSREYTLSIHHSRITALGEEERERLAEELQEIAFTDQSCSFFIKL